jgi:hypothetical protein
VVAELDALAREKREYEHRMVRAERERIEAQASIGEELDSRCDRLMSATLQAAGFHQHRGEWRKRRDRREEARQDKQEG